jgi:hypothetical protein
MIIITGLRILYNSNNDESYIFIGYDDENMRKIEIELLNNKIIMNYINNSSYTWKSIQNLKIDNIYDIKKYILNIDTYFSKTIRHKDKRPVWIIIDENSKYTELYNNINIPILNNMNNKICNRIFHNIIITNSENDIHNIISRCNGNNEYIKITFHEYIIKSKDCNNVYLFNGESNIGKSYISHKTSLCIYETDMCNTLPEKIDANIVVIGQKYNFNIYDIISSFVGNYNFILVNFNYVK